MKGGTAEDNVLGGKDNIVHCIFILFCLFILSYLGEGDVRLQKRGKSEVVRSSFLIARNPSCTMHTTSTRPVFDNVYS